MSSPKKEGRSTVGTGDQIEQLRCQLLHSSYHLIAVIAVKSVPEVELQGEVSRLQVVEEDAAGMNKTTQCAPNGDWSQTSTLFVQGNQGGTKGGGPSRDSSFTSRRVASVSLLGTAIPSSEEARRTAPLKSPSSSLAETLPAKVSTGSRMNLPVRLLGADWTMVGFVSSLISWLVCEVKLLRWPPLSGTLIVIVIVIDIHHLFLIFLMSIIYIYI